MTETWHAGKDPNGDLPNPNPAGQKVSPEQPVDVDPASLAAHYELADVRMRPLLWFAVGLFAMILVALLITFWLVRGWTARPVLPSVEMRPALVTPALVPGPGLDAAPEARLDASLRRDRTRLHSYGWVDRAAGVVHIPIDEAMRLLVAQETAAREGAPPDFRLAPAFRLDSSGGVMVTEETEENPASEGAGGDVSDEGDDAPGRAAPEEAPNDAAP